MKTVQKNCNSCFQPSFHINRQGKDKDKRLYTTCEYIHTRVCIHIHTPTVVNSVFLKWSKYSSHLLAKLLEMSYVTYGKDMWLAINLGGADRVDS